MKRLVVCSDGTLQGVDPLPTNVVMIAQAIKPLSESEPQIPQIVFYDEGVGTENIWGAIWGSAFGTGIDNNIIQCYQFLCWNYHPGDEIYLYGFSRGAYTMRSLAGLINFFGGLFPRQYLHFVPDAYNLLYRERRPNSDQNVKDVIQVQKNTLKKQLEKLERNRLLKQFREQKFLQEKQERDDQLTLIQQIEDRLKHVQTAFIHLLGCWDTVGSLGVPNVFTALPLDQWLNHQLLFHDIHLNPYIKKVAHAVSIDEPRVVFKGEQYDAAACQDSRVTQVWFPGNHGSVGGGTAASFPLSTYALLWMVEQTQTTALELDVEILQSIYGLALDSQRRGRKGDGKIPNYRATYATRQTLAVLGTEPRTIPDFVTWDDIHDSAKFRLNDPDLLQTYCPLNLLERFPEQRPAHCVSASESS